MKWQQSKPLPFGPKKPNGELLLCTVLSDDKKDPSMYELSNPIAERLLDRTKYSEAEFMDVQFR
jgi:hypothetical protein